MSAHVADCGPVSIRIYTSDERPRLISTMRLSDLGSTDDVLRAHGWHRVTPWAREDAMPEDHRVAIVVPS